jgi:ATP-binding cassette subfamily B protein
MMRLLKQYGWFSNDDDYLLIKRIVTENAPRHWMQYALAMLMTVIVAACTSLAAYLIGTIVNATFLRQEFSAVATLSLVWCVLFAIRGFATYGQDVFVARAGNRITAETQLRIFDKMLKQGVSYFADRHSTEFMASALVGAAAISNVINQIVLTIGRDLLSMAGLLGLMIWQDPLMSLISLAVMPPALIGVEKLVKKAREIASTQFIGSAAMLGTMQEIVQGFRIVKAFNIEDSIRLRVNGNITTLERASNKLAQVSHWSSPLVEAFGGVAVGLACLYTGYRVLRTGGVPGEFVSFMLAFILTFEPARRLARVKIELAGNLVMARALFGLFDTPPTESDDSKKPHVTVKSGRIEFSNVKFGYRQDIEVLRGLSFVAEPGRLTALVGPSGGGKSTVFNLLLRFYDVSDGSITIDGQNIEDVARISLRDQISYVGQEIYLFNGTVRQNLLVGKPDASDDELVAATRAAYAHDFIAALPQGYDTPVGEFGANFSLGQRQRISIARALIKNAPIVLLDEPTAALDSESEDFVQKAIRRLCFGKTTLAIAHRLNTIRDADCIHVLERGCIVESDKHQPLMSQNGRYATFFKLQFP